MEYTLDQLPNGIRLIHLNAANQVAHCGIMINTGTRDEAENQQGLAHFLEHVLFKGTKKRRAYHILSRMEDVGGEINAYTTKEETCVYSTFLKNDYERAIELISDITFHSIFPEKELEKEKEIILEEINSYKDTPSESIFDDFEELVYQNHSIGRNILGTPESLKTFNKSSIEHFIKANYHTDQMVICSIGDIKKDKLLRYFHKYFKDIPANFRDKKRNIFNNYLPEKKTIKTQNYQGHCIIGGLAYGMKSDKKIILNLLINILGGPGLNSRLNMNLREKYGLAYHTEANYTAYSDTGILNIYFGSDKELIEKSASVVLSEMKKLRTTSLGSLQLKKAKKQLLGQLAISLENKENLMLSFSKYYLMQNKIKSIDEIAKRIENISALQLLEVANEIFDEKKLSILNYE